MTEAQSRRIVVIGAGVGGLASAIRLAALGASVTLLDRRGAPGGKMRTFPSAAGPVDAGPTVLTMRHVFEELFEAAGHRLEDHVTLHQDPILARHFWPDGSTLDLHPDRGASAEAVRRFAGADAGRAFETFCSEAEALYDAFEGPMMHSANPDQARLTARVLSRPRLIPMMAPGLTLASKLANRFTDPRLRQLFGRYATYVGGSPYQSPALLALIWRAEEMGVWHVEGGMHKLAQAMADLFEQLGGSLRLVDGATRIEFQNGSVHAVHCESGAKLAADAVVFAGDPRALAMGSLGRTAAAAVTPAQTEPRSLSAWVWAFAAVPEGAPLAHHNVFFTADPRTEFDALQRGEMPDAATLYVCAQDRGAGARHEAGAPERFEIIQNGAPDVVGAPPSEEERILCQTRVFQKLRDFGLHFDRVPPTTALSGPGDFAMAFPGSEGSLYGPSPHGTLAALKKPRARTPLRGLYLAGGGVHPGAGVPMATLSGKHAAAVIAKDLALTSPSRPTATRGGTSTVSAKTAPVPSRSSVS
ncbi:MAG: 1-hydroxycarotenoid 3,4-desaturase CrtD [Pseudomonadota bacterium]